MDESRPVSDDPAAVTEALQRHADAGADTAELGALQPVVEAIAGWRDRDTVATKAWLEALEATPDALYLRTDDGVFRHRPTVTDEADPEPFRVAEANAEAPATAVSRGTAAALLDGATVTVGLVDELPADVRARFRTRE